MSSATTMIPVDPVTAAKYYAASDEERRKVQLLVRLLLRDSAVPSKPTLQAIMDAMSDEAESRGLTAEIFDQIFNENDD